MRRRGTRQNLSELELHFLLTGECTKKGVPHGPGWLRPFTLVSPAGREELRALWLTHREELLREWKRSGRRGSPWAAKEFDGE